MSYQFAPNGKRTKRKRGQSHQSKLRNTRRWRGSKWKRGIRDVVLARDKGLCQECLKAGTLMAATDVDHIIPIATSPSRWNDLNNLQSLCKSCHSKKTAEGL